MKTNNKPTLIPMNVFAQAAAKYLNCKSEDIETRMITENTEAFIIYKNKGYRICTREQMREDLEFQLTDAGAAQHIDYYCWIEATKNTVALGKILGSLVRKITDNDQAMKVHTAVGIASHAEDDYIAFWEILSTIDDTGLLIGSTIVATAEIYNGAGLVDDLLELQIVYGESVYNTFVGGIFADTPLITGFPQFYIYSADYDFND